MTLLRIAMVTPSYNQAPFIDKCLCSILGQNYPNLDYRVFDGGSTDGSVEIIRKHGDRLTEWRSGPDDGPYSVINEGFSQSDAEILGWLNSDDMLLPGSLRYVAEVFETFPEVHWITTLTPGFLNGAGDLTSNRVVGFSRNGWLDGRHQGKLRYTGHGFIQQESTFFRRSLWEKVGGLRTCYPLAADFDLWSRFFEHTEINVTKRMIGAFRSHMSNRSEAKAQYYNEVTSSLSECRERLNWKRKFMRERYPSLSSIFGSSNLSKIGPLLPYRNLEISRFSNAIDAPLNIKETWYS